MKISEIGKHTITSVVESGKYILSVCYAENGKVYTKIEKEGEETYYTDDTYMYKESSELN